MTDLSAVEYAQLRQASEEAERRLQAEDDEVRSLRRACLGSLPAGRGAGRWERGALSDVAVWINRRSGRKVLLSVMREDDGRVWLHGSVSRGDRATPTYDDLVLLHRVFMEGRLAYQVFAPAEEHYDLPHGGDVLHLWAPLTGPRPTPDFRSQAGTV